jgi:large subunit ribosomal protein L18
MEQQKKLELRQKRIWRVRKKVKGTAERPRLCVSFTNKNVYAQAINDDTGKTLVFVSTLAKDLREEKLSANLAGAKRLGALIGQRAKAAGLSKVVFDRHGRLYHGCVKAFAEAAREAGLDF